MIDVLVVVATAEQFLIECLMRDIINRLYTDKAFDNKFIKLNRMDNTIQIDDDIYISFCTADKDHICGYRPDYFWTDSKSKDAENYLTAVGSNKLGYGEIISVIKKGE